MTAANRAPDLPRIEVGVWEIDVMIRVAIVVSALVAMPIGTAWGQDRETKVRNDKKSVLEAGHWIYNDLPAGLAQAKRTGKPLAVVFRCVPCHACAQLDAQVVSRDPAVRGLLDQFVCVRIVHANGMDLSLFDFDYDQSFAAFLMNADKTIYGRYGTRSHQTESKDDVSVEGFAATLRGALELHRRHPADQNVLAGKRGGPAEYAAPELYPSLRGRYGAKLDYIGKVTKSCIHCHQLGEAKRLVFRSVGKPIPDKVLYPWPLPSVVGLTMDPKAKAKVSAVEKGSSAEGDGYRAGDEIVSLEGQPLLSIADFQWLLQNAGETATLQAKVRRAGKLLNLPLSLESGWRRRGDISWRATSWDLRRMATGGILLEDLSDDGRQEAGLSASGLALLAKHVGQYGAHAVAKEAGFLKGDILVSFDGLDDRMTESEVLAHIVRERMPGKTIPVTVVRQGKRLEMKLPLQ